MERHAHVSEELLTLLGKVPKAASDLALYLFRHCIEGKFEEIDLYNLPLGEGRKSKTHRGKRYSQTTLRGALKTLEDEGLVLVRRRYPGGFFSLTVQHPGKTRAFQEPEKKLSTSRENTQRKEGIVKKTEEKTAKTESVEALEKVEAPPLTKEVRDKAIQAAFEKVNEELKTQKQTQEPCEPQKTVHVTSKKKERDVKTAQTEASNDENAFPLTEVTRETTEQTERVVVEKEKRAGVKSEFMPLRWTACDLHKDASSGEAANPASRRFTDLCENEANEICSEIRQLMRLTLPLKMEALKHSLLDVRAALKLFTEKSDQITNPQGWLTQCLRQKWVKEARGGTFEEVCYPELTRWYAWASEAGIVDGRPLAHCPRSHPHSTSTEFVQVALMIPPHEQKLGFPPFQLIPWQDAITLYPMEN